MENAIIITEQVFIMFLLIALGIFSKKRKIISDNAAQNFSHFMSVIVIPIIMISILQEKSNPQTLRNFWFAFFLSLIYHIIAILLAVFLFPKKKDTGDRYKIEQMCAAASNCAFMGLPLIEAVLGPESLIYGTASIAVFNLIIWPWGAMTFGGKRPGIKMFLKQPQIIAVGIGLLLFVFSIQLPQPIRLFFGHVSSLNTPLAMILLGVFLADVRLKEALTNKQIYKSSLSKNLLSPLIFLGLLVLLRVTSWYPGAGAPAQSVLISAAASSAVTTVLLCAKNGNDSGYAAQIVAVSTLFSILSIGFVVFLGGIFL